MVTAQCLSGSGALRMGFEFIRQELPSDVFYSSPTWSNHLNIVERAQLKPQPYPYYDPVTKKVKINELIDFMNKAKEGNIFLLHVCAHNPTGVDPSMDDWKRIADVMEKKKLIPFFDTAYQGFASGDLIKDSASVRYFAERNFSMFVAQSYAKNMGLYGERVGALHIVTPNKETSAKVLSQLKLVIRASYSSPPLTGARIAERILNNEAHFNDWSKELKAIAERVISVRQAMRSRLEDMKTPGNWEHITNQIGMFSFTGLNEAQVGHLVNKYHIHMLKNGRMAMVGLNTKNVNYVAEAVDEAVRTIK